MACGVRYETLIARIGHDGSAIIWPDLSEPFRRRAFHIQEITESLYGLGWLVAEFCTHYASVPTGFGDVPPLAGRMSQEMLERLSKWSVIVLGGTNNEGFPHTIYGKDGVLFDTDGSLYKGDFQTQVIWLCFRKWAGY